MKSLFELVKSLYGPKAISSTLGTRTNVVRLPGGKLQRYLKEELNIEQASDAAAKNAYNEMQQLIPDIAKMNDAERLIFEGNLRRLKNKLEASGLIPKPKVEGEVIGMESKEKITGEDLKKLTEEKGTVNPPTSIAGQLEQSAKKMENLGKNIEQEFTKGKKRSVSEILDEYFHSYSTMKQIEDEGLVRAVARQIMYADLNAGRLKVPKEVEDTIRGMSARDVLDDFNQWYGFAALEDLYDNAHRFYRMSSPQEAVEFLKKNPYSNWENVYQPREKPIKEYMTQEEFRDMLKDATMNRHGVIVPKGSEKLDQDTAKEIYDFYLKTGDRKLIQEEIKAISEGNKFDSFATEDKNKIIDILTDVLKKLGLPTAVGGVGLEYLAEKGASQTEGGTQQSLGLDYLTGMEPSEGYANGGRIGFKTGGGKKIFDIIKKANEELKVKKSMEKVNPKTGEVTVPEEPVKVAEEPRTLGGLPIEEKSAIIGDKLDELSKAGIDTFEKQKQYLDLRLEFIDSLDPRRQNKALDFQRKSIDTEQRLLLKAEEKGLDFDTFEKLRTGLYGARKQKTLDFIKTGKVDVEPIKAPTTFQEVRDRYKNAAKAHEEIQPNFNDPRTAASSLADVMAEQKYGKTFDSLSGDKQQELYVEAYNYISYVNQLPKVSPQKVPLETLEYRMNQVLNQYDKSMFIKNDQGLVDVTHPQNIEKMRSLLQRDHPELYEQISKHAVFPEQEVAYTKVGGKTVLDASDPETISAITEFAKKTDPEGYAKLQKHIDRLNQLIDFKTGQKMFENYDLETYNRLTSQRISQLLNQLKNPYKILDEERNLVRTGFTSENFEGTGLKNLDEINFKVDKKKLETHLEDLYNKKQIEEAQSELSNLRESGREPNATGGSVGLNYLMGL